MYNDVYSNKATEKNFPSSLMMQESPEQPPIVMVELENLRRNLNELGETLAALFDRLSPVLLHGETKMETKEALIQVCPLAEGIRGESVNVFNLIQIVHSIHDALQL